jgi:2-polyprenyl-3-methyl-5-hydroxy-6-metoxy-1,4-benzoquinol methylase
MEIMNSHNHFQSQSDLVAAVLADFALVPEAPSQGRYLNMAEAEAIVAATIHHSAQGDSAQEYLYLKGHRKRLAETLTMIPKAESAEESCLDIGCYGYMAFWAFHYLGYTRVEGIEMRPGEPAEIVREIEMKGKRLAFTIHNFDISQAEWPLDDTFDTLLFFETLEHVSQDPSGVMLNVTRRMTNESTLVISVPNSVSYKTLQEFMAGAPPWTYWFFNPDLTHEPRHSFEYTPIFFKILLRCAGLDELAFRTITAYVEPDTVSDYFDIGRALSIEPHMFGETMIVQARKVSLEPLFRNPDCIYDSASYYNSTYPLLRPGLDASRDAFFAKQRAAEEAERAAMERANKAEEAERAAMERANKAEEAERAAREQANKAEEAQRTARERVGTAVLAEREIRFLCDMYRLRLDTAELAERAAEERAYRAEETTRAAEERAHLHATLHNEISNSSFWRLTGPMRRALDRFPMLASSTRDLGRPLWRTARRLLRGGN